MSRPSKPLTLVKGNITKKQKEVRKKAENALLTQTQMREWPEVKNNKVAHRHFIRVRKLFKTIDKNDALHEAVINRYCIMLAEADAYETEVERLRNMLHELENKNDNNEMEYLDYIKMFLQVNKQIQTNDRLLQNKRKMLLDIEKENIMTIASQLRSVPKKPPDEEKENPMAALLGRG